MTKKFNPGEALFNAIETDDSHRAKVKRIRRCLEKLSGKQRARAIADVNEKGVYTGEQVMLSSREAMKRE